MARAAVNAAVAQALKDRGIQLDGKTSTAAQQQALLRDGSAVPEFQTPGGPVPVPPPGGAANDNAQPPAAYERTPKQAALDLQSFLERTQRFGSKSDRPDEVRAAQRDLGVTPDGIVGPITRKAAAVWNVTLPAAKRVASKSTKSSTKKA